MREVRRRTGAPVSTDFANSSGTPIVVNTTTGAMSTITDAGTIVTTLIGVSNTATLDFPSIASNGVEELTVTVTGAAVGSTVILGAPSTINSGLTWIGFVSATDTVTIRLHNNTGGSVNPASATWKATVIQ